MDYIVTAAKDGSKHTRQKYTQRNAAIEKFERLLGAKIETVLVDPQTRHDVRQIEAKGRDGSVVVFRERA